MAANVYVFNLYNEPITGLSVGGYKAGDIAGYADGKSPPPPIYTPASLAVPRSKTPQSSASFAIGANPVVVPWDSFRGTVSVVIPDPKSSRVSLDDPLILFLSRNEAVLLTTRGFDLETFPVALSAVPAADAELPGRDRPLEHEDV